MWLCLFFVGFGFWPAGCLLLAAVASLTGKYLSFPEQQIVIRVLAQPLCNIFAAMRRLLLCTAALTAAALKPAVTRRGWCTGAAAAITSLAPQVASADGVGPGMFVETKNIASNPDASLSRDPMNSNVLFSQDFYFKYGRSPPFLQDATSEIPDGGAVPFTRVQQRYEAYGKYAARVLAGVEAFRALKGAVDNGSWATVASDDTKYNLRAMGLLANGLMASENNGPGNVLFLTRWYVNECAPVWKSKFYGAFMLNRAPDTVVYFHTGVRSISATSPKQRIRLKRRRPGNGDARRSTRRLSC